MPYPLEIKLVFNNKSLLPLPISSSSTILAISHLHNLPAFLPSHVNSRTFTILDLSIRPGKGRGVEWYVAMSKDAYHLLLCAQQLPCFLAVAFDECRQNAQP
jgi:hypothetical protein